MFKILSTSYPLPGWTKMGDGLDIKTAREIAHEFYGSMVVAVEKIFQPCADCGYSLKTPSGYAAIVGTIDGAPAILHKNDDGSRTLNILESI